MRVKFVHVATLLPADVAFPRVGVGMAALVQEVQGLVGKDDTAINALKVGQRPFAV